MSRKGAALARTYGVVGRFGLLASPREARAVDPTDVLAGRCVAYAAAPPH